MSTFVLIHGAWHGAWCWYKVAARLEAAGHSVIVPDLPGHGLDRTPTVDVGLDTYVNSICALLDEVAEPVVLVGHSMGGAVITQVAEHRPEKIKTLVYLAAFLLEDGMSLFAEAAKDSETMIPQVLVPRDDGTAVCKQELIRDVFYGDCSDDDVRLARSLLVPQSLRVFKTPVSLTQERFGTVDRVYIEATQDKAISLHAQRLMTAAQPCREIVTLEASHSPFLSQPQAVVDALINASHGPAQ